MKNKLKIVIGVATVLLIGLVGFCAWSLSGSGSTEYYTQIDNSKVEQMAPNGGVITFKGNLPYSYTLLSYDENGSEKAITFGASRELRDGAFICLTVMPVRGVLDWSEVRYDELPAAVQDHYPAPSDDEG
ncbi:MAG: YxeA family protein [Lachnospiraceae bacterium]|nr:YxeA family protein [Lachnospiraceae bacterium]